jgi:hypothetical protein
MKTARVAVLTFLAVAGMVVPAIAQVVIYDSFGPGNSYNSGVVWAVSGASTSGGYRGQAEFFIPGFSAYLSSVQLATYRVSGSALSNFYIAQDDGTGIPGVILEAYLNVQNVNGLLTINSSSRPRLQAGTKYWLCDEPAASNAYNGWWENSQNVINGFAFERSQWSWSAVASAYSPPSGVFRVTVTPVPEPSATGLLALCGGLLGLRFRRIRSGK